MFKHVNLYTEGDTPEHCSFQIYFYSRAYIHAKFTKCKGSKLKSHFQFSITVNFKTRLSTKTFLRKTKEKKVERERAWRKKGGEEKKVMVALLGFIMVTLDEKQTVGRKRSIWR